MTTAALPALSPLPHAPQATPAVRVSAPRSREADDILTPAALAFVARLHRRFNPSRQRLLARRREVQERFDAGDLPDFLRETEEIRRADWKVAPPPADLVDRRVEITGPVDRKMVINALNSGARVYMADFEDSHSPTWEATVGGQANLRDAVARTIEFTSPEGKRYALNDKAATLVVRPRGWHLDEKHVLVDGQRVSASLFDFGLFLFHNARALLSAGTGPYFYLPKLESHLEARLWNKVFRVAQDELGLPRGTVRATVLIETLPAAFEMHEILYELREHITGLNCGRWDYIFSFIKKFRNRAGSVLPDRGRVTMATHFLRSYSQLLIQTCHRRGAHAMGGMAAYIPVRNDPAANLVAMHKVAEDKQREADDGHDGTWVAHPGLVPLATKIFDERMAGPHQLDVLREDVRVSAADLLAVPPGPITDAGLRTNVNVALQYLEAWLRGNGCVPIANLMEDAATAEICRAQVWQWIRHPSGVLEDGRRVTPELVRAVTDEELGRVRALVGGRAFACGRFDDARRLFERVATAPDFVEFLTLPAYDLLP